MTYELKINPKLIALAAAGAAVLGCRLDEALLRPVVQQSNRQPHTPTNPQKQPHQEQPAIQTAQNQQDRFSAARAALGFE